MFGINPGEFAVLAIVALVILGPEKLPTYAAQAARLVRDLRQLAANARAEVSESLGPEFKDISLRDLDPRTFVTEHLLDGEGFGLDDDEHPRRGASGSAPGTARARSDRPGDGGRPVREEERPPYDPDAT